MGKAAAEIAEPIAAPTVVEVAAPEVEATVAAPTPEEIARNLQNPNRAAPLSPALIDAETLWLARCIFSETKRPEEQELVAWVIRNRVETGYRGQHSYRDVVLDPYQFSAFNPGTRTRLFYSKLGPYSKTPGWRRAMALAYSVRHADSTFRPFPHKTRHFYSERSMVGGAEPDWAKGIHPVTPRRPVELEAERFRFYAGVY